MEKQEQYPPMGSFPEGDGISFRVWAPHAERVFVTGEFNGWSETKHPMHSKDGGEWFLNIPEARIGHEYRYLIRCRDRDISRMDPYSHELTTSVGNSIVFDPEYDWEEDDFTPPPANELVLYELHVGTFNREFWTIPGDFENVSEKFDHLRKLGVNALEIMPVKEFAGGISWGYNPSHIFTIERAYGGTQAFKDFVKAAHRKNLAVILDVVYNHFGPTNLDLWRFDGWHENDGGGIYFYNDHRRETPWGATRPNYSRKEVRRYIRDNVLMWFEDYHVDGLRWDMTLFVRTINGHSGDPSDEIPEGWSLMQEINREVCEKFPGRILIAEDLQNNEWLTRKPDEGGAGFHAQWDAGFVHPVRAAMIARDDRERLLHVVRDAIAHSYNGDPFQRVIYTESHDEVANGKARVPSEISPQDPDDWFAQKRSTLGAGFVFTSPGIPMIFQGQEFLQGQWFQDTVPLDWDFSEEFHGILRLYRDLIHLRRNRTGKTLGLTGPGLNLFHVNDETKVIAFHRWKEGGPGDDVIVVAGLANRSWEEYRIGLPREGLWKVRFNSCSKAYSNDFSGHGISEVRAEPGDMDGLPFFGNLAIGPYSLVILSQDGNTK